MIALRLKLPLKKSFGSSKRPLLFKSPSIRILDMFALVLPIPSKNSMRTARNKNAYTRYAVKASEIDYLSDDLRTIDSRPAVVQHIGSQ